MPRSEPQPTPRTTPHVPARTALPEGGPGVQLDRGIPISAAAAVSSPQSLRREILLRLRQHGPASPEELARHLGASRTGVLQQLRALELAALVGRQTVRHGVGRPRHLYDVTSEAQTLFPSNYEGLAAGLLSAIRSIGGDDLMEELFLARRRQMGARIRERMTENLGPDATIVDRVRELAVIQDEQGYLAEADVDDAGAVRLTEHNCAIFQVAHGNPAACRAELELFRDVLGVSVVRESHIASGDRCCSYRVLIPDTAD